TRSGGQVVETPSQVSSRSHTCPALAARQVTPALPAGWVQVPAPSHSSTVQGVRSVAQVVPGGVRASGGQLVAKTSQGSGRSHARAAARRVAPAWPAGCWHPALTPLHSSSVHGLPSDKQIDPLGFNVSGGHVVEVPSQVSATSQSPASARQTVPALAGGCWHRLLVPLHWSVVHGSPSDVHAAPLGRLASAGQLAALPGQFSAKSHSPAAARQTVAAEMKASAGQLLLTPLHDSAMSQTPAAARHTAWLFVSTGQVLLVPSQFSAVSHTPAAA